VALRITAALKRPLRNKRDKGSEGNELSTPRGEDVLDDLLHAPSVFDLGEEKWPVTPHRCCISFHNLKISPDRRSQISFVDDKKVRLCNARTALARNFVAPGDVDHIDCVIRKFAAEVGCKIIAAAFQQQQVRMMPLVQVLQRKKICGDIFTNGGMRAAAGFDGADPIRCYRLVT